MNDGLGMIAYTAGDMNRALPSDTVCRMDAAASLHGWVHGEYLMVMPGLGRFE